MPTPSFELAFLLHEVAEEKQDQLCHATGGCDEGIHDAVGCTSNTKATWPLERIAISSTRMMVGSAIPPVYRPRGNYGIIIRNAVLLQAGATNRSSCKSYSPLYCRMTLPRYGCAARSLARSRLDVEFILQVECPVWL